jgi:hypothetical protein
MVGKSKDGQWINLLRPEMVEDRGPPEVDSTKLIASGVFRREKLVNMSKHDYTLEPNATFTPDMKWIVFRTNMFGESQVLAVEIEKAKRSNDAIAKWGVASRPRVCRVSGSSRKCSGRTPKPRNSARCWLLYCRLRASLCAQSPTMPPTEWIDPGYRHKMFASLANREAKACISTRTLTPTGGKKLIITTPSGISTIDWRPGDRDGRARECTRARHRPKDREHLFHPRPQRSSRADPNTKEFAKSSSFPKRGGVSSINAMKRFFSARPLKVAAVDANMSMQRGNPKRRPATRRRESHLRRAERSAHEQSAGGACPDVALHARHAQRRGETSILKGTDWLNHLQFSPTDPA